MNPNTTFEQSTPQDSGGETIRQSPRNSERIQHFLNRFHINFPEDQQPTIEDLDRLSKDLLSTEAHLSPKPEESTDQDGSVIEVEDLTKARYFKAGKVLEQFLVDHGFDGLKVDEDNPMIPFGLAHQATILTSVLDASEKLPEDEKKPGSPDDNQEKQAKMSELERQNQELRKQNQELRRQNEALSAKVDQLQREVSELSTQVTSLQKQVAELTDALNRLLSSDQSSNNKNTNPDNPDDSDSDKSPDDSDSDKNLDDSNNNDQLDNEEEEDRDSEGSEQGITPEEIGELEHECDLAQECLDQAEDRLAKAKNRRESIWSLFKRKKYQAELDSALAEYQNAFQARNNAWANLLVATSNARPTTPELITIVDSLADMDQLDNSKSLSDDRIKALIVAIEAHTGDRVGDELRQALSKPESDRTDPDRDNLARITEVFSLPAINAERVDELNREILGELAEDVGTFMSRLEARQLQSENRTKLQRVSLLGDWLRSHPKLKFAIGVGMGIGSGFATAAFGATAGAVAGLGYLGWRSVSGYWSTTSAQRLGREFMDKRSDKKIITSTSQGALDLVRQNFDNDLGEYQDKFDLWRDSHAESLNDLVNNPNWAASNVLDDMRQEIADKVSKDTRKVRHRKMVGVAVGALVGAKLYNSHHGNSGKPGVDDKPKVSESNPNTPKGPGVVPDQSEAVPDIPAAETLDTNQVLTSVIEHGHGQTHEISDIFHQHVTGWDSLASSDRQKLYDSIAHTLYGRSFIPNPDRADWLWNPGGTYGLSVGDMLKSIKDAGLEGKLSIDPSSIDIAA